MWKLYDVWISAGTKTALLEHSHIHLFTYYPWLLSNYNGRGDLFQQGPLVYHVKYLLSDHLLKYLANLFFDKCKLIHSLWYDWIITLMDTEWITKTPNKAKEFHKNKVEKKEAGYKNRNWVWWHIPIISGLGKLRQEDVESWSHLGHRVKSCTHL